MNRSALILSCAIHGSVLAMVGWSTLLVASRTENRMDGMSVSISMGENSLVGEELPAPTPTPEIAPAPAETSFTPPVPTIDPVPTPAPAVESTPPSIPTVAEVPRTMPSIATPKRERPATHARGSASRKTAAASSGGGAEMNAASGAGGGVGGGGGGNYTPPQFLARYKPPYPDQARAQRLEGVVMLLVSVDTSGRVTGASIHQGSGYAILDRAALEAVRTWRFTPARQGDRIIPATVELPIRFHFSS